MDKNIARIIIATDDKIYELLQALLKNKESMYLDEIITQELESLKQYKIYLYEHTTRKTQQNTEGYTSPIS